MTPHELPLAVVQRDDQPVVVPGQRAAAVARRLVGRALDAQPCARLVAGQQEAALDLELRGRAGAAGSRRRCSARRRPRPASSRRPRAAPRAAVAASMISTETLRKPSAARMPWQTSCMIASIESVSVRRPDTRSRCSSAVRWRAASRRGQRVLHRLGGVGGQRREHREVVVGRPAPGDGLVDRHDAEHVPLAVAQGHEERVLRMPGVGGVGHLEVGDEGDRLVPGPVELVPRQQEAAVALEAQVEQRLPLRPRARAPEQRVTALVGAVDGLDAEVVPGRPVERDDHRAVAHAPRPPRWRPRAAARRGPARCARAA